MLADKRVKKHWYTEPVTWGFTKAMKYPFALVDTLGDVYGGSYQYSGLVEKPTVTVKPNGQDKISETSGEAKNPGPRRGKKQAKPKQVWVKKKQPESKQVTRRNVPMAKATTIRPKQARVTSGAGWMRIQHSEILDTIVSTEGALFADNLYSYTINPGLFQSFPWLSTQALGFERYRFNSLAYEYVPRCPVTTQGGIIMAPDYDPDDLPPQGENQMSTYKHVADCSVFEPLLVRLNPADLFGDMKMKYNRYGTFTPGGSTSIREYDGGTFFAVMVDTDVGTTTTGGKLWVHYDVTFHVPRTLSIKTAASLASLYILGNNTLTPANPFGLAPTVSGGLGTVATGTSVLTITKPCNFMMTMTLVGTGLYTVQNPIISATDRDGNAVNLTMAFGIGNAAANAGTSAMVLTNSAQFVNAPVTVSIAFTGTATTITQFHLYGYAFSLTYDEFS